MDNKTLIDRIAEGDMEAFSALVERYQHALYSVAFNILNDFHQAQDIAQEAFIKAYMHLSSLRNPEQLGSWLYSIAHRLSLNALRSRRRIEPLDAHSAIADPNGVEDTVMRNCDRQRVRQALSALEASSRTAVVLHYFGGLSVKEISRIMGASPDGVESRIRRARLKLKKELVATMEEMFKNERLDETFKQKVLDKIITKEPFALAGYRIAAPFPELGKHVRASVRYIVGHLEQGLLSSRAGKDIVCLIPPQTLDPHRPMLFVGIELAEHFESALPEGMETFDVPCQRYAVSTFRGTLDQYDEFHRSIPGVISEQGYEPIDMWQGYGFELYPEKAYDWSDDSAMQEIRLHWVIK